MIRTICKNFLFFICFLCLTFFIQCNNNDKNTAPQKNLGNSQRTVGPSKSGREIICIKDPQPTHIEKKELLVELDMAFEIPPDIDGEHFMVRPWFITADNQRNFWTMDIRLKKLFGFKANGEFLNSFGAQGVGPGEFGPHSINEINISYDGLLNVSDNVLRRLTRFTMDGKFVSDFKIPANNLNITFKPVVSREGDIFVRMGRLSTLDVYNINQPGNSPKYRLLGPDEFHRSLVVKLRDIDYNHWTDCHSYNVDYDLLPDGRLVVFLTNTATLYIYKGAKLEKKFDLWPKWVLDQYKEFTPRKLKEMPDNGIFAYGLFMNFFIDQDDYKHIYLPRGLKEPHNSEKAYSYIYKFDLEGNLVNIYFSKESGMFRMKKNNRFYALRRDSVQVFKIKDI